jgi:hypothetical protein
MVPAAGRGKWSLITGQGELLELRTAICGRPPPAPQPLQSPRQRLGKLKYRAVRPGNCRRGPGAARAELQVRASWQKIPWKTLSMRFLRPPAKNKKPRHVVSPVSGTFLCTLPTRNNTPDGGTDPRMSRGSKITLAATGIFAVTTIVFVHFQQRAEKTVRPVTSHPSLRAASSFPRPLTNCPPAHRTSSCTKA